MIVKMTACRVVLGQRRDHPGCARHTPHAAPRVATRAAVKRAQQYPSLMLSRHAPIRHWLYGIHTRAVHAFLLRNSIHPSPSLSGEFDSRLPWRVVPPTSWLKLLAFRSAFRSVDVDHTALSKRSHCPMFASEPVSPVALCDPEILLILNPRGSATCTSTVACGGGGLAACRRVLSYRQVCRPTPAAVDRYESSSKTLGPSLVWWGRRAARGLLMTVAVSVGRRGGQRFFAIPELNPQITSRSTQLHRVADRDELRGSVNPGERSPPNLRISSSVCGDDRYRFVSRAAR